MYESWWCGVICQYFKKFKKNQRKTMQKWIYGVYIGLVNKISQWKLKAISWTEDASRLYLTPLLCDCVYVSNRIWVTIDRKRVRNSPFLMWSKTKILPRKREEEEEQKQRQQQAMCMCCKHQWWYVTVKLWMYVRIQAQTAVVILVESPIAIQTKG